MNKIYRKSLTFFEVFQDIIVQVNIDLCLFQFDIFGKLLDNKLFALLSIIYVSTHHFWSWYLAKWYFIMDFWLAGIKIDTPYSSSVSTSIHPLLSLGIIDGVLKVNALLLYLLLLLKLLVNLLGELNIEFCTIRQACFLRVKLLVDRITLIASWRTSMTLDWRNVVNNICLFRT